MRNIIHLFILKSFLFSAIINIPQDYATIQSGIEVAANGDTVLIAQGVYYEHLLLEKEIVLASHAIYDDLENNWLNNEHIQETIISGSEDPDNENRGSCLVIRDGNIQPTIIGLTFQDGRGSSMEITECDLKRQQRSGGAILIFKAYPTITYNRFMGNGTAQALEAGEGPEATEVVTSGGGIGHFDDEDIEFDEDRSMSNRPVNTNRTVPDTMVISNNYFANNSSGNGENIFSHGYGGFIDVSGSVFDNIDCESNTVNEFVLHSIDNEASYIQNDISGGCINDNTYYVSSEDGDNNNSGSETDPFRTITHALSFVKAAGDPTTIYVAPGEYSSEENGETFPIVIPDNVHLIGDEAENTILDADADSVNQAAVIIINEVENVYVASMTLTGGYSEGHGCAGGGALLVSASDMSNLSWDDQRISMATLENLIIENSHSHNGGGISFYRVAGPSLTDVVVSDNTSSFQGGGIFIYASDVTMNSVTVENNTCLGITFQGMDNFGHGGGVFLNQSTGQFSELSILNNNASSMGGGIWSSYGSGWTLENSIISGNMAPLNGGGIALWDNNSQGEESSPTIINTVISDNSAVGSWWSGHGGGFWINNSNPHIIGSDISNNSSNNNGGGFNIHNGSDVLIDDSIISNNEASWIGGGIRVASDAVGVELNRCLIIQNNSDSGGGVSINSSVGKITNCTIVENNGTDSGGLDFYDGAIGSVVNSIIWQNSTNNITSSNSVLTVQYSNIGGLGFTGEGNINEPPIFDAPHVGDYSLGPDSPCIDSGTADFDGDGQEDLTNYNGQGPDMGAFESFHGPTELQYVVQDSIATLWWSASTDPSFQYYVLERSTHPFFSEGIDTMYTTSPVYDDTNLDWDTFYYYRVATFSGSLSEYSDAISLFIEWLNISENLSMPSEYVLRQNYPNPFNPVTILRYELPEDALVNITIYDMVGRVIKTLVSDEQSSGYKSILWDATNNIGQSVSAGVYVVRIEAGEFVDTRKMLYVK